MSQNTEPIKRLHISNFLNKINEKWVVDWDFLLTVPQFAVLENCGQNPRWHSEGNAWIHTKKVTEAAIKTAEKCNMSFNSSILLITSAIFHDIGKGVTTKIEKDGKYHAYGHEFEGERLTRELLFDEDIDKRETICSLVRYHMEPLKIFDGNNLNKAITKVLHLAQNTPIKILTILKRCDCLGSVLINEEDQIREEEQMTNFINLCKYLGVINLEDVKPKFRRMAISKKENRVYVLVGISGSGKSTVADRIRRGHGNAIIISRDIIRHQLGFCKEGEKAVLDADSEKKVTEEFNRQLIDAIKHDRRPIIDNLNIKKKYRDAYKELLKPYNVKWTYVYCEAPDFKTNVKRREGEVSEEILSQMIHNIEWPEAEEYDNLIIVNKKD